MSQSMLKSVFEIWRDRRKRVDSLSRAERQKKIYPMSHEQLAAFLGAAFDRITLAERLSAQDEARRGPQPAAERAIRAAQRDAVLFLTLADTGLRPGEALGAPVGGYRFGGSTAARRAGDLAPRAQDHEDRREPHGGSYAAPHRGPKPVAGHMRGGRAGDRRGCHALDLPLGGAHAPRGGVDLQALSRATVQGEAAAVPPVRSPAHLRDASTRARSADYLCRRPTRPREAYDDARALCALAPTRRQDVDRPPGRDSW